MGIHNWYNVFGDSAIALKEKDFKNRRLGIDVSYDIYRASLGMQNIKGLTNINGNPTVLINTLLCNAVKYKKLGVTGLIYVFDNPTPNPHKIKEQKKRTVLKQKAKVQYDAEKKHTMKEKLEKRIFTITDKMIADVKKLLSLLGIAWIVAPFGYEAEHLGAELSKDNIIDSFITSDSDALLFGAKSFIRRVKKGRSKKIMYEEYKSDELFADYDINRDQLVHIGVVLGSDFADKTKGIGPKTVLNKGLDVKLTKQQQNAKEYFLSSCPYDIDAINKNNLNKNALIQWLVDEKNFNMQRITKLLSVF